MLVVWQGQGHDDGSVGMQQFTANAIHKRLEVSRGGRVYMQEVFVEIKGDKYEHGLTLLECKASDILVRETRTQRHGLVNECVLRPAHTIESVWGARSILLLEQSNDKGGEEMVEIYPPLHGGCNQKGPFGGWNRISR